MSACHYCGEPFEAPDLRPYGPGGAMVCHTCATETPEREAITAAAFAVIVDATIAISPGGAIAITPTGLRPFDPAELDLPPDPEEFP